MNPGLFFLFVLASAVVTAQNNTVVVSKRVDTIHSAILNEDRYLWVHIPEMAVGYSKKIYPVIYVLDGQVYFDTVNDILTRLR